MARIVEANGVDRYDFSKVIYTKSSVKILVRRIEHDEWFTTYAKTMYTCGAPCKSCMRTINIETGKKHVGGWTAANRKNKRLVDYPMPEIGKLQPKTYWLYVVKIKYPNTHLEPILKVGVTKHENITNRFRGITLNATVLFKVKCANQAEAEAIEGGFKFALRSYALSEQQLLDICCVYLRTNREAHGGLYECFEYNELSRAAFLGFIGGGWLSE